ATGPSASWRAAMPKRSTRCAPCSTGVWPPPNAPQSTAAMPSASIVWRCDPAPRKRGSPYCLVHYISVTDRRQGGGVQAPAIDKPGGRHVGSDERSPHARDQQDVSRRKSAFRREL